MNRYTRKMAMVLVPSLMLIVGCGEPKPGSADGDTTVPELKDGGQDTKGTGFPGMGGPPAGTTAPGTTGSAAPTFGGGLSVEAAEKKVLETIANQFSLRISKADQIDCQRAQDIEDFIKSKAGSAFRRSDGTSFPSDRITTLVNDYLRQNCTSKATAQAFSMAKVERAGRERRGVSLSESDQKPCDCGKRGL